jgi:hypothetical protein
MVLDVVQNKGYDTSMKYTVRPLSNDDCDCPDCRAGKHLYELYRWVDDQWKRVGFSLQGYASAEDCKQNHCWCIGFHADDTWEDGTPITPPEDMEKPASGTGGKVFLDMAALQKSAEALERHWLP